MSSSKMTCFYMSGCHGVRWPPLVQRLFTIDIVHPHIHWACAQCPKRCRIDSSTVKTKATIAIKLIKNMLLPCVDLSKVLYPEWSLQSSILSKFTPIYAKMLSLSNSILHPWCIKEEQFRWITYMVEADEGEERLPVVLRIIASNLSLKYGQRTFYVLWTCHSTSWFHLHPSTWFFT